MVRSSRRQSTVDNNPETKTPKVVTRRSTCVSLCLPCEGAGGVNVACRFCEPKISFGTNRRKQRKKIEATARACLQPWHSHYSNHPQTRLIRRFEEVRAYVGLPFDSVLEDTYAYSEGPVPLCKKNDKKQSKWRQQRVNLLTIPIGLLI